MVDNPAQNRVVFRSAPIPVFAGAEPERQHPGDAGRRYDLGAATARDRPSIPGSSTLFARSPALPSKTRLTRPPERN